MKYPTLRVYDPVKSICFYKCTACGFCGETFVYLGMKTVLEEMLKEAKAEKCLCE